METMVKHAIQGYNAMPARGLCADCSDQEIADAVAYMVDGL
jgi:cytochrome c5